MLPGFRFLFTAIVLSMSILIFGLGAAALLRAAHEEFANLPARRAPPQPMFARQNDDQPPTLALLRVDTPVVDTPAIVQPTENAPAAAVPEAAIDVPAPAEPDKLAALKPAEEPVQVEAAKPEAPVKEASAETAPAPAAETEAPATNAEVKVAAIAATPEPAAATPPATSPEPAADIPSFEGNIATTLIATLGGPAVFIDEIDHRCEAGPQRRQEAGRTAGSGTAANCGAAGAPGTRGRADSAAATTQSVHAVPGDARDEVALLFADQAGPVATGGPSAAPHSVHEPSYSAGFSTPRR